METEEFKIARDIYEKNYMINRLKKFEDKEFNEKEIEMALIPTNLRFEYDFLETKCYIYKIFKFCTSDLFVTVEFKKNKENKIIIKRIS